MSNILSVPQNFSTTLNIGGGINSSQTTGITLTSVTGLPTDGGILAFDWANPIDTTTIEYIEYGSLSSNDLASVTRGQEGYSAKAHSNGAKIVGVISQAHIKRLKDNFTAEHDRSAGTHNVPTSSLVGDYAADTGAANAYVVTLSPVPTLVTGMKVRFKATNANTTASTLNVNSLGAKAIKKYDGATALVSGDIAAGQIVNVIYDGTNFQLMSPVASAVPADSWQALSSTLAYSSADGHTFVVTSSADMTGLIGVGDRIKFTNNSTTFFGIVTAIASGTITIYGGTNYTVANSAITNPFYSHAKVPYGFIPDPAIWTDSLTDTTLRSQSLPAANTWYNPGSLSLAIPIGKWKTSLQACGQVQVAGYGIGKYALSTANNTGSDIDLIASNLGNPIATTPIYIEKILTLASKTSYFVNCMTPDTGDSNIGFRNELQELVVKAVCAYL